MTFSKFVSDSSNSFRFTKPTYSSTCFMKDMISFFFSGRRGISSPVFVLPNMDEASFIFSISSRSFSSEVVSDTNKGWNLTSSMYLWSCSSFDLSTSVSGR